LILVKLLGHIGTSVGTRELNLDACELEASEVVERVRSLSGEKNPGFTRFNTIVMVEDGEAFVPAGISRIIKDGERISLVPFSHGG
jgi:molybdopterin converting factor small subunit